MENVLAWFITSISTAGLVTLWFMAAYRELVSAKQGVENARWQILLDKDRYSRVRDGPETAA